MLALCVMRYSTTSNLDEYHNKHEDGDTLVRNAPLKENTKEALNKDKRVWDPKTYICKFCDHRFIFRYQFTNHILKKHSTLKPCTNFVNNKCKFCSECWFNQIILT